ncbi:hypothetical protein LTS18_013123, partial [Coniosporium uncinatum]
NWNVFAAILSIQPSICLFEHAMASACRPIPSTSASLPLSGTGSIPAAYIQPKHIWAHAWWTCPGCAPAASPRTGQDTARFSRLFFAAFVSDADDVLASSICTSSVSNPGWAGYAELPATPYIFDSPTYEPLSARREPIQQCPPEPGTTEVRQPVIHTVQLFPPLCHCSTPDSVSPNIALRASPVAATATPKPATR